MRTCEVGPQSRYRELAFLLHFWFYSHPGGAQQPLSFETEEERLPPLMDAKKGKTRKESTPIKVWVTPEENTLADVRALQTKMSERLEDI